MIIMKAAVTTKTDTPAVIETQQMSIPDTKHS